MILLVYMGIYDLVLIIGIFLFIYIDDFGYLMDLNSIINLEKFLYFDMVWLVNMIGK